MELLHFSTFIIISALYITGIVRNNNASANYFSMALHLLITVTVFTIMSMLNKSNTDFNSLVILCTASMLVMLLSYAIAWVISIRKSTIKHASNTNIDEIAILRQEVAKHTNTIKILLEANKDHKASIYDINSDMQHMADKWASIVDMFVDKKN